MQLKTLTSDIDTKQDLTVYLAGKNMATPGRINKSYIVSYDKFSATNL